MAPLLASLKVRLALESADFTAGLDSAREKLGNFGKQFDKFQRSTLAQAVSFGALAEALKKSISAADDLEEGERRLAAQAKLSGVALSYVQQIADTAQKSFHLSGMAADDMASQITTLASRAGELGKSSAGLSAFLDLGAARGLSMSDTMEALNKSVEGMTRGVETLLNGKPDEYFKRYAAAAHTTVAALTQAQRSQAMFDAVLQQGGQVRGEFQKWLGTSAGAQYLLGQSVLNTEEVLGKALLPALVAVIPVISQMATGVSTAVHGWQELGSTMGMIPGIWDALKKANVGDFSGAKKEIAANVEAWRASIAEIQKSSTPTSGPTMKAPTMPAPNIALPAIKESATNTAKQYFSDLQDEWEDLAHNVKLTGLSVAGTDAQKLDEDERHARALLDVEKQDIQARLQAGDISQADADGQLKQLAIRQQLTVATRLQMGVATQAAASQTAYLDRTKILLDSQVGAYQNLQDLALARLGSTGSISSKLKIELDTAQSIYDLKLKALQDDSTLSAQQRDNALTALNLAKQRADLQMKGSAAIETTTLATSKTQGLKDSAQGDVASLIGSALGGQKITGKEVGSDIGALGAQAFLPGPIGAALGSGVGGLLGGLLDSKNKQDPIINHLAAIEFNTRDTVTTVKQSTDRLLNLNANVLNLPSNFSVPGYMPQFAAGGSSSSSQTANHFYDVSVTVNGNANPLDVKNAVNDAMGAAMSKTLSSGRQSEPRGRRLT